MRSAPNGQRWHPPCADSETGLPKARETTDVEAALAQPRQVPLDVHRFLDAMHVPEDAGEYAPDLIRMLTRIPDGWGRWIRCKRGWYPLIIETDRRLAALCPEYELQQVKQKWGTLRYYCDPCPDHRDDLWETFETIAEEAEARSRTICEVCGGGGDAASNGNWVMTLCDNCITRSRHYTR